MLVQLGLLRRIIEGEIVVVRGRSQLTVVCVVGQDAALEEELHGDAQSILSELQVVVVRLLLCFIGFLVFVVG